MNLATTSFLFMIGRFFWDIFGALSCRFWSIAPPCGAQLPTHTLNYWTELSGVLVFWLVVYWTRSRLLVVGLLSIAEHLCPSLCLFGTILVTFCLMVWDWRGFKSRANAFLLARSALSFLTPTILSFSSFHGLVVWGWWSLDW